MQYRADYRPDIDGLRALAVAGVLLFHAGFDWIGGGFAGVDVFFVISGYLITSIIVREQRDGTFSLARFYERRARRILPALLLVLLPTSVAALLWLEPNALRYYAQSVVAVLTFSSNFLFMAQTSGYFAPSAEQTPLIHTWSLAVEEQFYILFPLALAAAWRFGLRRVAWGMLLLALASLVSSEIVRKIDQNANFYLVVTRVWELLAGALLALCLSHDALHRRLPRIANELLTGAGVLMICAAFVVYDERTQFPSVKALLPTLGVLLVIAFGAGSSAVAGLLSARPLVLLGLVSYSAYLWHQPLFAFARMLYPRQPPPALFCALIVVTLALAYLSWKFVEVPLRNPRAVPRRKAYAAFAAASAAFVAAGVAVHLWNGLPQRYEPARLALAATALPSPHRWTCVSGGARIRSPEEACRDFHPHVTWAALGDSHVIELSYALARRLSDRREGVLHLSFAGCPPAFDYDALPSGCRRWMANAVEYLEADRSVHNVLLGFRDTDYLFGEMHATYPALPDVDPKMRTPLAPDAARELYWSNYVALIERLLRAGKRVHVLYPVPELPKHVHYYIYGHVDPAAPVTSLDHYARRHAFMLRKLATLPWSDRLVAVDPARALCGPAGCRAVIGDAAMYYDDDHLSVSGATRVLGGVFDMGDGS